jgi:hypothetical protein
MSDPLEIIPPNYFPEHTVELAALHPALFKFQGLVDPIKKAGENEHLKSTYADLTAVWAAIRGPLEECGLLVLQEPHPNARGAMVTTTVVHVDSGEWRRSTLFIPARKADAQAFGSALTYCRRYGVMTVLGLLTTDDDGHAATLPPPEVQPTARPADKAEVASDKGWQAWAQGKLLQLQSCDTSSALAVAWSGMQPELKKAPAEVRAGLTSCKDQQKDKLTGTAGMEGDGNIGDDVPF